jgi:multidrug efflux pump
MVTKGAGAESLQVIGVLVFYGVIVSVFLTLAVVPAVYSLVARNTSSPEAIGRLLEKVRRGRQPAKNADGTSLGAD